MAWYAAISNVERAGHRTMTRGEKEPKPFQQQVYDNTLKSLLQDQAREILSLLIDGIEYVQTLDGEALKPTSLRTDRFYLVLYHGVLLILHIELETAANSEIGHRMLEYFGILYKAYKMPIIPVVIYPFRTSLPASPLRIMSGNKEILVLHYQVIALWTYIAQKYLDQHEVAIYALLPTMEGANYERLAQALDEMKELYNGQPRRLADHLLWFGTFLDRTDMVPLEDKRRIQKKMENFASLLDENPFVQQRKAEGREEGRAEGREEGRAEGLAEGLQKALVTVVEGRFPPLVELAQQRVTRVTKPDALNLVIKGIVTAPDEATARLLLDLLAA